MLLRRIISVCTVAFVGALVAVGAARRPLRASAEEAACILNGPGILCYTVQTQICVRWVSAGASYISTGATVGQCAEWGFLTDYYYGDPTAASAKNLY